MTQRLSEAQDAERPDDRWAAIAAEDDLRLSLRVSHAAGRELGERLYRAFTKGSLTMAEAREAFSRPPAAGFAAREVTRLHRLSTARESSVSETSLAPAK